MNASNSTKIALVTGGVTGIGRAIVLRLTKDGFCVVVNYKNSEKEKEAFSLMRDLQSQNKECFLIKVDVSDENEVKEMIKKIRKRYKKLDVVVNNAGINQTQNFRRLKLKDFDKIMDTNLRGAVLVTKYSLTLLKKSESPKIIFVSSMNSFSGSPFRPAYIVSKIGVVGLMRSLALELAPKISVNAIVPGYIDTQMLKFGREPLNKKTKRIPLKRLGKPEEVAGLVSFLCSSDSSYITGQSIHINGGLFLT